MVYGRATPKPTHDDHEMEVASRRDHFTSSVFIIIPLSRDRQSHQRAMATASMKKEMVLDRLGGTDALRAAVDEFYLRLVKDEELQPFFEGVNVKLLKWHQYNFMSIAFTEIPEDLDVPALIRTKHARLFLDGLTETHFDIVAGHFVATLKHLKVKQPVIDEAVGVIAPLRPVFAEAAIEAQKEKQKKLIMRIAILIALLAVAAIYYTQNMGK